MSRVVLAVRVPVCHPGVVGVLPNKGCRCVIVSHRVGFVVSLLCFLLFPQSVLDKLHGGLKAKIVILPLVSCQFHIYCYVNVVIVPSQCSSINFPGW